MPIWKGEDGARDLAAERADDCTQRRDRIARVVPGNGSADARLSYRPVTRAVAVSNGPTRNEVRRAVAVDVEPEDVDTDNRIERPCVPRIRRHIAPIDQQLEVPGEGALELTRKWSGPNVQR